MKILLADDHTLFRESMLYVLRQLDQDIEVIQSVNFKDAMKCAENDPHIKLALLDLSMPDNNGMHSIQLFNMHFPKISIVIVSASENPDVITAAAESGALGFIPKTSTGKTFLHAIKMVLDGGEYFPSSITPTSLSAPIHDKLNFSYGGLNLTERQIEVLHYLMHGFPNKKIAENLGIAEGTVKIHVSALLQVLGARNRMEAVIVAKNMAAFSPNKFKSCII